VSAPAWEPPAAAAELDGLLADDVRLLGILTDELARIEATALRWPERGHSSATHGDGNAALSIAEAELGGSALGRA